MYFIKIMKYTQVVEKNYSNAGLKLTNVGITLLITETAN
jgi:hypothetical protein